MKKSMIILPIVGIAALVGISSKNVVLAQNLAPVSKTIDPATVVDTAEDYDISTPEGFVEYIFRDIGDDEKVILTKGGGMIYGQMITLDPETGEQVVKRDSATDPEGVVASEAKKILLNRLLEEEAERNGNK